MEAITLAVMRLNLQHLLLVLLGHQDCLHGSCHVVLVVTGDISIASFEEAISRA